MPKYAKFDHTQSAPQPVIGWIDTDAFAYRTLPDAVDLLELSSEEWVTRMEGHSVVDQGRLVKQATIHPSMTYLDESAPKVPIVRTDVEALLERIEQLERRLEEKSNGTS